MKRNVEEEDEMITRRMESTSLKTLLTLHFHSSKAASSFSFLPPFSFSHFKNKNNNTTFNLSFSARCSLSERGEQESCLPNGVGQAVREVPHNRLLQVVLVSPQIPGNTGCIARTCAASGVGLHLVEPLGFKVEDTKLKRAGLDYWSYVVVKLHSSWTDFQEYFRLQEGEKRLLAFTKRGTTIHSDFSYRRGDWLVFGAETFGLPPEALHDCKNEPYGGGAIRIPMIETYVRCLNLSVSVGISLYEASRQLNYEQLQNLPEPCADGSSKPFITEDVFA